jgi:hypothetical protein
MDHIELDGNIDLDSLHKQKKILKIPDDISDFRYWLYSIKGMNLEAAEFFMMVNHLFSKK